MSKSRGNVVIPDEYIAQWGADTFRMYLMFLGPFQEGGDFRDSGHQRAAPLPREGVGPRGPVRARRRWPARRCTSPSCVKRHQTVKKVTEAMEGLSYNTAIAALMELLNVMRETNCSERHIVKDLVVMLAPFAPHFAEECWERLGGVDDGLRGGLARRGTRGSRSRT